MAKFLVDIGDYQKGRTIDVYSRNAVGAFKKASWALGQHESVQRIKDGRTDKVLYDFISGFISEHDSEPLEETK